MLMYISWVIKSVNVEIQRELTSSSVRIVTLPPDVIQYI